MTDQPLTPEERLARLEGVYNHLATKADLAELKAELKGDIAELKGSFKIMLVSIASGLALLNIAVAVVLRFWQV